MAGLLARGFALITRLPGFPSGMMSDRLAAYSCGGSLGMSPLSLYLLKGTAPNSLFNPIKEPSTRMLGRAADGVNRARDLPPS
jgi:hypothetical protein